MFPKRLRPFLVLPILLILLILSLFLYANFLIQKPSFQESLIRALAKDSGMDIHTGQIEVNIWGGVGLLVHGLDARSRKGTASIVASKVRIILKKSALLKGHIVPVGLSLIEPKIEAPWDSRKLGEGSNVVRWAKGVPLLWLPDLKSVSVRNGRILVKDQPVEFSGLQLSVNQIRPDPVTLVVACQGEMGLKGEEIPFGMKGTVIQDKDEQHLPVLDMRIQAKNIPIDMLPWPNYLLWQAGSAETSLKVEGRLDGAMTIGGGIAIEAPRFAYREGKRKKVFTPTSLRIDFRSVLKGKRFDAPSIQITAPDAALSGALRLDLEQENNPWVDLVVNGPFIPVQTFKKYMPLPLLPSWFEETLFPMLEAGEARLANLSLKGNYRDIERITLPKNQSLLSLRIECSDVTMLPKGVQQPVRDISAAIVMDKGNIVVSGLGGHTERSTIRAASLDVNNVFADVSQYAISLVASLDIQELLAYLNSDLIPKKARPAFPILKPLSGTLECLARIHYQRGWDFPRITSGELISKDLSYDLNRWFLPLRFQEARVVINRENKNRFQGKGKLGNSAFDITGEFAIHGKELDFQQGNISGAMDMNEVLTFLMNVDHYPLTFNQPVQWRVAISKTGNRLALKGQMDLQGIALQTDHVTITPPGKEKRIQFDLALGPGNEVNLKGLTLELAGSSLEMTGSYNIRGPDVAAISLSIPGLSMDDLGVHFKRGMRRLKGLLEGKVQIRTSLKHSGTRTFDGHIRGKDFFLIWPRLAAPVEEGNFSVGFSGKKIHIASSSMRIGQTPMKITGDLDIDDGLQGEITAESDYLHVEDLWPARQTSLSSLGKKEAGAAKGKGMDVLVHLKALQGRWRQLNLGPTKVDMNVTDEDIYITNSKLLLEHGLLRFKGHVRRGEDFGFRMSSYIQLSKQPAEELLESIGIEDRPLKGSITMEAYFFSQGEKKADLLPNLNGTCNVLIENGTLVSPDILVKVFDFLSVEKIFIKRPPDVTKEGFYFESIGGNAQIKDGLVKTDNLIMKSPTLNAVATGEVDLAKKTLDVHLGTQPLETVDVVVSKIPILGYILTGDKHSLLTYYFVIKGPMNKPEVTHIPFKSLGSGMAGLFKRLFLTPVRIFKDISDAAKNLPEPMSPMEEEAARKDTGP